VSVVILLADGARPDTLDAALNNGALPALARLRDEGGLYPVTSCFPSVTGPAYAPFLMGRYPGPIGLPGLRWFDRSRAVTSFPDYTRSYVGYQMRAVDGDIDPTAPTIFELSGTSVGALNVINRGLPKASRIGSITARSALRAATTHFSGNVAGWLQIDREVADQIVTRVRDAKPNFVFAAFTGVDKVSHARGHDAPLVLEALKIVDDAAARIRADAERDGRWNDMSLWIVSDHGHSPVSKHEDLVKVVQRAGYRTISHPWVFSVAPEVAVMVSGNAMAHLYLDVQARIADHESHYAKLVSTLEGLESVDLLIQRAGERVSVHSPERGKALMWIDGGYHYQRTTGDPLGIGRDLTGVSSDDAFAATIDTDYPDGVVQVVHLALSSRAGEIILSAARDWDFRARYEPIPHLSSHGALHREHIMVPLLVNRPPAKRPHRTVDVMPSALAALGKPIPAGLDGRSFF
jgi:arylsulfatase A-like enzyme